MFRYPERFLLAAVLAVAIGYGAYDANGDEQTARAEALILRTEAELARPHVQFPGEPGLRLPKGTHSRSFHIDPWTGSYAPRAVFDEELPPWETVDRPLFPSFAISDPAVSVESVSLNWSVTVPPPRPNERDPARRVTTRFPRPAITRLVLERRAPDGH